MKKGTYHEYVPLSYKPGEGPYPPKKARHLIMTDMMSGNVCKKHFGSLIYYVWDPSQILFDRDDSGSWESKKSQSIAEFWVVLLG